MLTRLIYVQCIGLFDCGAKSVHGTALLVYKGSSDSQIKDVFKDGATKYSEYINIKGNMFINFYRANLS